MDPSQAPSTFNFKSRLLDTTVTSAVSVPTIIEQSGSDAKRRFVEFFAARIRNANTRSSYMRAVGRFCHWLDVYKIELRQIEPTLVAAYIEELMPIYAAPSVKQHLAAIRMLLDYLVTGGILPFNSSSSVRGPKHVVIKGKTPVLQPHDARHLLDSIATEQIADYRDRALIALMLYTFARVGAAVAIDIDDVYQNGRRRWWVRLKEKGGRMHEMPLHHTAEKYLLAYLDAADLHNQKGMPLFRTLDRRRNLTETRLLRQDAWRVIKRRCREAGLGDIFSNHTMRASGITAYMLAGGTLEKAQQMAAHASSRTTNMYNRSSDAVTLDEVERILI